MGTVFGTGVAATDVAAVRNELMKGEDVILQGQFSFDLTGGPVTAPVDMQTTFVIEVTRGVTITGMGLLHSRGSKATITGGLNPFRVNAPGENVTIQGLYFKKPQGFAISAPAVKDLVITNCKMEGVLRVQPKGVNFTTAAGIVVGDTTNPRNSGVQKITNNVIDTAGDASDRTLGILINHSDPNSLADIQIIGNTISKVTGFGIDLRGVNGFGTIQGNNIAMGAVGNADIPVAGIRCMDFGIYMITGLNKISCGYERAAGIRVVNTNQAMPDLPGGRDTRVNGNEITMSRPEDAAADSGNAGIELKGNVGGKSVSDNKVSGRATAAISLIKDVLAPFGDMLTRNRHTHDNFISLLADIFIADGVPNTQITAPDEFLQTKSGLAGTIFDGGMGTTSIIGDYSIVG